jgi:hypothetical protein
LDPFTRLFGCQTEHSQAPYRPPRQAASRECISTNTLGISAVIACELHVVVERARPFFAMSGAKHVWSNKNDSTATVAISTAPSR